MNTFGDFLYALRKEKGMTQAELADKLGVTNKAVSKWETGEAMPETGQLLPISQIFGVSVDELLSGRRAEKSDACDNFDAKAVFADEIRKHIFTRGKDEENKTLSQIICGAVCAALFLSCVGVYLLLGALADLWVPYWVLLPVGALTCGCIGILFDMANRDKRAKIRARGKNPFTGYICGLAIISCTIAYLLLGALAGLWHPYWLLIVLGALACGIIGPVGEISAHKKKVDKDIE